jgi:hypothetical protein
MASATDVGLAALLKSLISADPVAEVVLLAIFREDLVAEFVLQSFRREITLSLSYPLLEPHVRRNHAPGHPWLSLRGVLGYRTATM